MAHSFIEFRHNEGLFSDGDLSFITGAVIQKCRVAAEADPSFQKLWPLLRWWLNVTSHPGPGCIDLKLDEYLREEEDAQLLYRVLQMIDDDLIMAGKTLSAEYLNQVSLDSGLYESGIPTTHFTAVINRFRSIILGNTPVTPD